MIIISTPLKSRFQVDAIVSLCGTGAVLYKLSYQTNWKMAPAVQIE